MKISIITVVYNNKNTINDAIESVLSQAHKNIEYIIIDGGSTDGTPDIINKYRSRIAEYVSEPDHGIYDAMNKGIRLATGNLIGFLNADDFYADKNVIADIDKKMNETKTDCCYGDLEYVAKNNINHIVRRWKSRSYYAGLFECGWHPPHPTFFVRREIFEKYGVFDTSLTISADYELMLRFLNRFDIKSVYIPRVIVKMRTGGISGRNLWQITKANWQCYRAWKINNLSVSPITILRKPLSKITQCTSPIN
jgi:glycosyltransferase involved in cell wall biosynthesis